MKEDKSQPKKATSGIYKVLFSPEPLDMGRPLMRKLQDGLIGVLVVVLLMAALFLALFFVRFKASNEVVSGIAYNTTNDHLISGNTTFSVRASESTYTTKENQSSYCLPPGSPYKKLVNEAAQDKRIKIVVTASKYFAIQAPWACYPNVTVAEVK